LHRTCPLPGASLIERVCGARPFIFSNLKTEQGLADIIAFIEREGMLQAA